MNNNMSPENKADNPRGRASFEPRRAAKKNAEPVDYWDELGSSEEKAVNEVKKAETSAAEEVVPKRFERRNASQIPEEKASAPRVESKKDSSDEEARWSASTQVIKGTGGNAPSNSVFWPLAFWAIIVAVVAFVLPDLPMFSHIIDTEGYSFASESDTESEYISANDEGALVLSLQKNLCKLGYLTYDEISGKYDETTRRAVNEAMVRYGVQEISGCSQSSYDIIASMASTIESAEVVTYSDIVPTTTTAAIPEEITTTESTETTSSETSATTTTTTTQPTTTTTTGTTAPKVKMARITAEKWTKLREQPDKSSVALYNLDHGDEFEILEEKTDADGNLWYRLKFFYTAYKWRSGWAQAEYIEVFYE